MLELRNIQKRYDYIKVLDQISMTLPDVGMIGIVGASGCGKSTLLNIIGGIDKDFCGDLIYNGKSVKKKLSFYRKKHVSFIFQNLNLIMWLSSQNNIRISHFFHKQSQRFDLNNKFDFKSQKMSSLSLGQRQKLAYLRACYHYKDILLCDEPTGSLDPQNAIQMMELLKNESKERLVIVVSHDLKLIQKHSDEIYEMKDGHIIKHYVYHHVYQNIFSYPSKKRMICPYIRLSFYSLMSHKRRTMQLIFGLTISLICIMITLTMSRTLEKQIYQYLYSLVPPSSITIKSPQNQSLDLDIVNSIQNRQDVSRFQLFLDDYELLGIGFLGEKYQESQTLFIGDDSSPYDHLSLKYGRIPSLKHEVLVSFSTAQHLCKDHQVKELIDKKIYAWYKYQNEVRSIEYHVVGITQNKTTLDTLYQKPNAYIELIKRRDQLQYLNSHLGIIYVQQDFQRRQVIKQLQYEFPQYHFIETGTSTTSHIASSMKQVKIVLLVFSSLAILSSLFLIGEVMFLNVIQKRKDFAIMACFGASPFNFIQMILCESFEIILISLTVVFILYVQLIHIFNVFIKEILIYEVMILSIDYRLFSIVCLCSFILVLLSQFLPLLSIVRLNTIEALKD